MQGDALEPRDVAEGDGPFEQTERGAAAGAPQRSVLVVGRAVVPFAEARPTHRRLPAWWVVRVGEDHEVGSDGAVVGLLEAGEREGAWDEFPGGGVGGRWGLVRVQGAAVVFWWTVLESEGWVRGGGRRGRGKETYRLGGSCLFRALLLSIGSKVLMMSSLGPGVVNEDDSSSSSGSTTAASVEACLHSGCDVIGLTRVGRRRAEAHILRGNSRIVIVLVGSLLSHSTRRIELQIFKFEINDAAPVKLG